jgi:hypothetical protein
VEEKRFKGGVLIKVSQALAIIVAKQMTGSGAETESEKCGELMFFWSKNTGKTVEEAVENAQRLITQLTVFLGPGEVWIASEEKRDPDKPWTVCAGGRRPLHTAFISLCRRVRDLEAVESIGTHDRLGDD